VQPWPVFFLDSVIRLALSRIRSFRGSFAVVGSDTGEATVRRCRNLLVLVFGDGDVPLFFRLIAMKSSTFRA